MRAAWTRSAKLTRLGRAGADLCDRGVDQPARYADRDRQCRQAVDVEPLRVLDLVGLGLDFAARIVGEKRDHQGMRKRPGLAAEIAQVSDREPHLLEHLALDAV